MLPLVVLPEPVQFGSDEKSTLTMSLSAMVTVEAMGGEQLEELRKLLVELQSLCCEANEKALKSFVTKDIPLAENVRNLRGKIDATYSNIERVAKDQSVDLMPQTLAAVSFLRQIYERSVDMADLVV